MKSGGRGFSYFENSFSGCWVQTVGKFMTRESRPEFPLLLLLLSHLRQAGTWTKVSSSIKMQRHYKGRKSAACMHSWDNYEQQDTKWSNPNSHYWGVGSKSKVVSISWHTAPPTGWADHLSYAFCLTHGSTPALTPHKGPACPPQDWARELVSLSSKCSKNSNETERDPMVLALPCPQPAFCPWKRFSHTLSLIREARKWKN